MHCQALHQNLGTMTAAPAESQAANAGADIVSGWLEFKEGWQQVPNLPKGNGATPSALPGFTGPIIGVAQSW